MTVLWIGCALAFGIAFRQLGLPPLVGFLCAGFALNIAGFDGGHLLEAIAHHGVLLLLFSVGLKVRLRNVLRVEVWGSALAHLALSAAVLGVALHLVFDLSWGKALVLATAFGFSSTVVAAKVLEDKRELRAFHGRIAIGILVVQDLVAVAILSNSGGDAPSPWVALLLGLPLIRPLLVRALDWSGHDELLVLFGAALALGAGGLGFEALGLSPELGALVMGALLAEHRRASELSKALWGLKEIFLVGFFLQVGLSGTFSWAAIGFGLLMALLLPLKAALFFAVLTRFGLRARTGFLAGLALASYSEFGLIIAGLGVREGWLEVQWLTYLSISVAFSFVLAAPLNRFAHEIYQRWDARLARLEREKRHPDDGPIRLGAAEVAIIGMGRVGTGAYEFLRSNHTRVVGLDSDPGKVEKHLGLGRRVVYADAEDPEMWQRVHLDGIRAVLIAVPDLEAKLLAVRQLRARGFTGLISATNVFPEEAAEILESGCTTTYNYFQEAGVGFAEHTLETLNDTTVPARASA